MSVMRTWKDAAGIAHDIGEPLGEPVLPSAPRGFAPPDRSSLRPQQTPTRTLSAADAGRQQYCLRSAERAARQIQELFAMNPRCRAQELISALGQGPLVDVTSLHGYSPAVGYSRVMEHRRDHHRSHRQITPDRISKDALAEIIGRSRKTLDRWYAKGLLPDIAGEDGMVSRTWAAGLAHLLRDLRLDKVRRLSDHQAQLLSSGAHAINSDDDTMEIDL